MINFKQQELIQQLFQTVRGKYPEIEFLGVTESPEDPADLWINVSASAEEDQEIEMTEFASELSTNLLLEYGYLILIMPRQREEAMRIKASSKNGTAIIPPMSSLQT